MPELPEVETVVRDLRPLLVGRTLLNARSSTKKLRRPWNPVWNVQMAGAQVDAVRRRGKWILVDLDGPAPGPLLRVHLGMTGQFTVVPASEPPPDHLHLAFDLDNGHELRFRDQRRFGSAEFFPDRAAVEARMNAELGPEPFDIDPEYFREAVRGTKRNLKAILLDQTVVAGVGNIYADEACFRAGLHPGRTGHRLTRAECDALREAVEAVLARAIESRGSTIRDYVGGSGLRGGFQTEFAVYGRTAQPCPACEAPIALARYAGRASHFCGSCQPLAASRQPAKSRPQTGRRGPTEPPSAA